MFNNLLSQPYRIFFLTAILNAIIAMLIFGLSYKSILHLTLDIKVFHIYSLIFLLFTNAFTGFLFTTFPKFNNEKEIAKNYYITTFSVMFLGNILFYIGALFNHYIVVLAMFLLTVSDILVAYKLNSIYESSKIQNKRDSYWILSAKYFGVLGNILFLATQLKLYFAYKFNLLDIAINFSFYLYLIFLAFVVAQKMVPFFSNSLAKMSNKVLRVIFILFVLKTVFATTNQQAIELVIDIFLGVLLIVEFHKLKLPISNSPAILWVLYLAIFWLMASFIISGFTLASELFLHISFFNLTTHLFAIGFLTTIFIGFATRVILGHSNLEIKADKFTIGIFIFIQIVLLIRALYSINIAYNLGINYLFYASFIAWIVLFVLWGLKYIKRVF